MSYTLQVSRSAAAYLERLDQHTKERLERKLTELRDDPLAAQHSKPLRNAAGVRSARVGGWRIIFTIDGQSQTVRIDTIAPRGQAYRGL